MIGGDKVLGVISARGGSKGLPRKNIRELAGRPLIAWTIEAARGSRYLDRVILSSDDEEIIRVAGEWGCIAPFVRPAELASDEAPGVAPVLHALEQLSGFGLVVLLQPTSPLREASDIDGCIETCIRCAAPACVSISEAQQTPYWMFSLDAGQRLHPLFGSAASPRRRQELPPVYSLNGAVYVARTDWLRNSGDFLGPGTVGFVMPAERSADVDDLRDLEYVEFIMQRRRHGTLQ